MVRLDVVVDPAVRRVMAGLVAAMSTRGLWREPATGLPVDDPDLRQAWIADLRAEAREDAARLRNLLEDERFGRRPVDLSEEEAESLVRACSTVRLRLRETGLSCLSDEALESGGIRLTRLPAEERRLYACYLFLAGLQSLLISHLDPDAAAAEGEAAEEEDT